MKSKDFFIKGLRKGYTTLTGKSHVAPQEGYELSREVSNQWIYDLLSSDKPCMISRVGSGECGVVANYLQVHSKESIWKKYYKYIIEEAGLPWWDELFFKSMRNNMGLFPENIDTLERFSERYLDDIPEMDLIGSMGYKERWLPLRPDCKRVHIESLYPFFVKKPWTRVLKGKKVLVVHPFVFSIKKQYENKDKLFDNPEIWPDYDLKLFRAVQSNAGAEVPYKDWFDALKSMEDGIAAIDFDYAIIGCGAYGLSLAASVKRMGKKAIHLGGGSQLLFGIKGRRWEEDYFYSYLQKDYTDYRKLFNEYWIRPQQEETPQGAKNVEGACYW